MTRATVSGIAPLVRIGGQELADATLDALIGLRISAGLRLPSRAQLDFLDEGFALSAGQTFQLGAPVVVTTADGKPLFKGEVTGVELDVERGAPNLTVIADDPAYKMTLGNKVRTFTQQSYSDVVNTIAREYNISPKVTATSGVHDYLLQSDSDFGFLTEMADRSGYDWWMDPEGQLQFHPVGSGTSGSTPQVGWEDGRGNLQHFSVRASALHPQKITANGWDAAANQPVTSQNRAAPGRPNAEFVRPYLEPRDLAKHSEAQTAYRMFNKQDDGQAFATMAAVQAVSGAVVASGQCYINPEIRVGGQIQVQNVGPASGTYSITEVEHLYSDRGFDTRFIAGERTPTTLVDTLAAPAPSSFRQDSLVVGVVTNLGSSESPKGYVKVKFPTLGSQIESAWARVVSTGAGDSRGMTFLPEVNDEVIIGFEGGDTSRPLVIGGLYSNAKGALDYGTQDGKVAKRQIVSRLGHVIELGDGDGDANQHIWLVLDGGQFAIKLGKDGLAATVPANKPVSITAGPAKIEIDNSGNITLAGKKITLQADMDVEISAGANAKVKATANFEASGVQAKVTGSGQAQLSSGGRTAVSGASVAIN